MVPAVQNRSSGLDTAAGRKPKGLTQRAQRKSTEGREERKDNAEDAESAEFAEKSAEGRANSAPTKKYGRT
jgi:hypothetical protein